MVERFVVSLHAYVLMDNHYHLLIQTPLANASRAIQWLNVSYSVWFNRRHTRCGHLFQGRFHSVLIEPGTRVAVVGYYVHMNPVRPKTSGRRGSEPDRHGPSPTAETPQQRRARWQALERFPWSSYRAYAGHERAPDWLATDDLWRLTARRGWNRPAAYRRAMQEQVARGSDASPWPEVRAHAFLGSTEYLGSIQDRITGDAHEQSGLKSLKPCVSFETIVQAVSSAKGEPWEAYCHRRGDWGRGLALALARWYGGLTLRELGVAAGGMRPMAVSLAIRRLEVRMRRDPFLAERVQALKDEIASSQSSRVPPGR